MEKCAFCDVECVKPSDEIAKNAGLKISKSKNNLLSIFYQHVFNYCPKCKMVELVLSENEKVVVKEKKDKIFEVLNNGNLSKIDADFLIRQAEVKGYVCEILGDNTGAVLGYKACVDLLDVYIEAFLDEVSSNVLNTDGQNFKVLKDYDMPTFEYAKQHRDLLNRLILGMFNEKVFESIGGLGFLIFLDTLLNVVELGVETQKLLKTSKSIIETFRKTFKNEEFKPAIEWLENKYLLMNKTFGE